MSLKDFIESRWFESFIAFCIVFSVVCFSIDTLPDLDPIVKQLLTYSEYFVIAIFTIEYVARVWVSANRTKFIFSFYGLVDLISIVPFYIAQISGISSLRVIRLLRLLRILKLSRYSVAFERFSRALKLAKDELLLFVAASFVVIYLAAIGIYHFEHQVQPQAFASIFDCLWWAVITLTTVGYGDIYPITVGGRLFTFVILIVGLGLVAVPTGIISTALMSVKQSDDN